MSMTHWRPDQPYNDLPPLPPATEVETRPVLKQCIAARAALAELKQAAELIPNQAMLINTIPLLEAKDSSEIENIVTTTDQLFRYAQSPAQGQDNADPATKEALRYRTALHRGYQSLKDRPLCTATAVDVCRTLKGVDMDIRRTPGTQLINDRTGGVIYTPPEGEARLRDMLANWERFLHNQTELDPLIRMAVGHYQFEAIHPFTDGNGRTGRVINILYLIQEELLNLPILYLSRHVIAHKADYYGLLLGVTRDQAWEPWLQFMLQAVAETSKWTTGKIAAIRKLAEQTTEPIAPCQQLPGTPEQVARLPVLEPRAPPRCPVGQKVHVPARDGDRGHLTAPNGGLLILWPPILRQNYLAVPANRPRIRPLCPHVAPRPRSASPTRSSSDADLHSGAIPPLIPFFAGGRVMVIEPV